jgi:hypothetical protein
VRLRTSARKFWLRQLALRRQPYVALRMERLETRKPLVLSSPGYWELHHERTHRRHHRLCRHLRHTSRVLADVKKNAQSLTTCGSLNDTTTVCLHFGVDTNRKISGQMSITQFGSHGKKMPPLSSHGFATATGAWPSTSGVNMTSQTTKSWRI